MRLRPLAILLYVAFVVTFSLFVQIAAAACQ